MSIPVNIFTGFLGSGKTTIIQNFINKLGDFEKIAIIKNEISDVGVDALELSGPKITVTELPNGCICCTLVGALNDSIFEILEKYNPERLIIEASGLAKPGAIVIGLDLVENVFIDSVSVIIDALNYKQLKEIDKSLASQFQSKLTDLYIINKIDQISGIELDKIYDDLLGNNPDARIIETITADLPADLFFGIHEESVSKVEYINDASNEYSGFESICITDFLINDINEFEILLQKLPKSIYRIKGYFSYMGANYIFNSVGGKTIIQETQKTIPLVNRMVFIGKSIKKYSQQIDNLFIP